jgi:hypothetical protein
MGSWVPATLASLARVNKRELDDHGGFREGGAGAESRGRGARTYCCLAQLNMMVEELVMFGERRGETKKQRRWTASIKMVKGRV